MKYEVSRLVLDGDAVEFFYAGFPYRAELTPESKFFKWRLMAWRGNGGWIEFSVAKSLRDCVNECRRDNEFWDDVIRALDETS